MCQSIEDGGARCAYHVRNSELRNVSARLRTVLKKIEAGGLTPQDKIEAINKRDLLFEEQQELLTDGENSVPDGWNGHLTQNTAEDLAYVKERTEDEDRAALDAFVAERVESDEYVKALETRDELLANKEELADRYKQLNAEYKKNGGDFEETRQAALTALDNNEQLAMVKAELDQYRAVTAEAVFSASALLEQEQRADGTFIEYTEESLGDLVPIGDFPAGSKEWLESRQGGIGGSDVGAIIRADGDWANKNYRQVLTSKVEPISDEQVAEQGNNMEEFDNAPARGNAWEEAILTRFSEENPDIMIAHCKSSWANKDLPFQYANFDGLMMDKDGVPDGIVEIKTGSNAAVWGDPEDGIDGVPSGYRAQVLWYMQAAHLKRGAVAVVLNDREYREYHWEMTPELEEEQKSNLVAAQRFWDETQDRKKNPDNYVQSRRPGGFPQGALAPGYEKKKATFRSLAAYREQSEEQVRERFDTLLPNKEDHEDKEKVSAALTTLYTEYDPSTRTKPVAGLDIETNGMSPMNGRIIEMGITMRNPDGTETKRVDQLHGLNDTARRGNGAGATHVHNINLSDLAGKPDFNSERNQKRIMSDLKNSGVMLAHNASYEDKWMRVHLKGYAEARDSGEITVLDTMDLSRHLNPDSKSHALKSFVEHNGGEYSGAHRAYRDAEIMTDAFFKFQDSIFKK